MTTARIRTFSSAFLDDLAIRAAATPRRRLNHNLHTANEYPCHRLFNALQADTYVQPHCHADPSKDETVVLLRGKLGLIEFTPDGQVVATQIIRPGMVVDIPTAPSTAGAVWKTTPSSLKPKPAPTRR